MGGGGLNQWQIVSLIGLLGWLVLAIRNLNSRELNPNMVLRSILIWGAIVGVIAFVVVNRATIAGFLAPIRALMP